MKSYIKKFIVWLLPFLTIAVKDLAVEVVTKAAYPDRPTRRYRTPYRLPEARLGAPVERLRRTPRTYDWTGDIAVILEVAGPNPQLIEEWLRATMPKAHFDEDAGMAIRGWSFTGSKTDGE